MSIRKPQQVRFGVMPFLAGVLLVQCAAGAAEMVIAENGRSAYRIVVADDVSVQDHYAARMLQESVQIMSGAALPLVTDDSAPAARQIVVGFNRRACGAPISGRKSSCLSASAIAC